VAGLFAAQLLLERDDYLVVAGLGTVERTDLPRLPVD
jgi:hypothetical protein